MIRRDVLERGVQQTVIAKNDASPREPANHRRNIATSMVLLELTLHLPIILRSVSLEHASERPQNCRRDLRSPVIFTSTCGGVGSHQALDQNRTKSCDAQEAESFRI